MKHTQRGTAAEAAEILERFFATATRRAVAMLQAGRPDPHDALLDANPRLLARHFEALDPAISELPQALRETLCHGRLPELAVPETGEDAALDAGALRLLKMAPGNAGTLCRLAIALARFLEDYPRLAAGRHRPLGVGFEDLFDERLERRFALFPDTTLPELFQRDRQLLMEEPDRGRAAVEETLGRALDSDEVAWLEVERRVAMLRFVRCDKTDTEGHIRWYVRLDDERRPVLARMGVEGWWAVFGDAPASVLARLGTRVERAVGWPENAAPGSWNIVREQTGPNLCQDYLSSYADRPAASPFEKLTGLRVCLVYVPSKIPHPLGGQPEVGLIFLHDHLERLDAQVRSLSLYAKDFEPRANEFLDADVLGVGVYIHNRDEIRQFLDLLQRRGFHGQVVLGGPETRQIDDLQATFSGWDAIVRGEAEEVLPTVLRVLRSLAAGDVVAGLRAARSVRGVIFRFAGGVLLCDTAARNRSDTISCPLPYRWNADGRRRLKMSFTRGCPFACTFCPNHQGRRFRYSPVAEQWRYTVMAAAEDLPWPAALAGELTRLLGEHLGGGPPQLEEAWERFRQARPAREVVAAVVDVTRAFLDDAFLDDAEALDLTLGLSRTTADLFTEIDDGGLTPRQGKELWLLLKTALLATLRHAQAVGSRPELIAEIDAAAAPEPFVLETSEDNTLTHRAIVVEYLQRRRHFELSRSLVFNPGQSSIQCLMKGKVADEELIALLAKDNPCAIAFGADGTSNPVLRQNYKPPYGIEGMLAVNKALAAYDLEVANNYILLTAETNLLEAVESFLLYLLLPVPWRDYTASINLRVIKEETTLATDEALIAAPEDEGFEVPFHHHEVTELLIRWSLSAHLDGDAARRILWRLLSEDPWASELVPRVIERWERDFDNDAELVALAQLVREAESEEGTLITALRRLAGKVHREALVNGRTRATFRDLVAG